MTSFEPSISASRLLGGEGPFDTFARACRLEARGGKVIHFELGEADFDTPDDIKRAGIAAIENNQTRYAPSAGIGSLREALAADAARFRRVRSFEPYAVVVGPGVKPILWNVMTALLNPGDEVIFADPAYPTYHASAKFLHATATPIAFLEPNASRFVEQLNAAMSPRTRVLILNSPHNPTGAILTRLELEAIAELAIRNDVFVISDEIYSHTVYEGEFSSIVAVDGMRERTIVLDGFSKTYSMTGWRLGYGIMPGHIAKIVALLGQNSYSGTATFVQCAGAAALKMAEVILQKRIEELRKRRNALVAGLNSLPGFSCSMPKGAFYAFPNISSLTSDDKRLASFLLDEALVAALGGSIFGQGGRGYLRFSYGQSLEAIASAIERMRCALSNFHA